ncbi:MAG: hypothetical protein QXF56_03620 [Candidatus Micrarchaeia archaeon]
MRWLLVCLLVTCLAFAAELDAVLTDETPLAGTNCRERGGATYYEVAVAIQNPSSTSSLRVTYEYYNSSSGSYEYGGKVCDVKAGMREACVFKVYTITGGKNGTERIPFNITGEFGEFRTRVSKVLEVTVNHYTSAYEENVMRKIAEARERYSRVYEKYSGCYDTSGLVLLQQAQSLIEEARNQLTICNLQGANALAVNATSKVLEAESYLGKCGETPEENTTPPVEENQTPVVNETSQPKENQTQPEVKVNETVEKNVTDVTSALMKACIPFFILLMLFCVAVVSV